MCFTFDSDTPDETRRLGPNGEPLYRHGGHGQSPRPGDVQPLPISAGDDHLALGDACARCCATTPPADMVRVELAVDMERWTDAQECGRTAAYWATIDEFDAGRPPGFCARLAADWARAAVRLLAPGLATPTPFYTATLAAPSLFQPADAAGEG